MRTQPNDLARFKPEPLNPKSSSLTNEPSPIKGNPFKKCHRHFYTLICCNFEFLFFFLTENREEVKENLLYKQGR